MAFRLFSYIQESLRHFKGKRVTLTKGMHQALAYLRWMAQDLEQFPTWLYKLFPLYTTLDGYNNASSYMCGGSVLMVSTTVPRKLQPHPRAAKPTPDPARVHRKFLRAPFPEDVSVSLVSWEKTTGHVTNSELEIADRVIHY